MAKDALLIKEKDNVATAIRDLDPQQRAAVGGAGKGIEVEIKAPIPFGHKFAVKKISEGDDIIKYGEVIGRATGDIGTGEHAHVQNIESLRGRGDWETEDL